MTLHSNLEEFYMKACVPVRKENVEATPDPSEFIYLLRDEQRVSLGEFVDGPYLLNLTIN